MTGVGMALMHPFQGLCCELKSPEDNLNFTATYSNLTDVFYRATRCRYF